MDEAIRVLLCDLLPWNGDAVACEQVPLQFSSRQCVFKRNVVLEAPGPCSRIDGRLEFWNGHHGFEQILRGARAVPESDGLTQRNCENFYENICSFPRSFLSRVSQSHH